MARKLGTFRSFAEIEGGRRFLTAYRRPSQARPKPHPLPEGLAGIHRMLAACKTSRERALVALCGLCGLRVSEAVAIAAEHVDLTNMSIRFMGKGDKIREVPISVDAFNNLGPAYVAARTRGGTLTGVSESAARKIITRVGKRAGLKNDVASHDLRATLATEAYDHTKDLLAVQEILGHANPNTTKRYIDTKFESMRAAISMPTPEL